MARGKLAVGLDIGSSSVKLVHLKEGRKGYSLLAWGEAPLPPETVVDNQLMNSAAVVEAVRDLFARQRVKSREVSIGVCGHSVIVKRISMPFMSQEELDESIQWEAEQYIPFDVKDVTIDTQILSSQADAAGQMDVLLVAAKKDLVSDFTTICAEAGLTATVVDVDAFAVQNAFEASYPQAPDQPVVLVNVGAAVTNVNVVRNGLAVFTRDITVGGNAITEEIQKQLNISAEEAEALKVGGHGEHDAVVPQEVERVIQTVAEQMGGEIQRSLDFHAATAPDLHPVRVYLSGGSARIPALYRVIEQRAGVPVEILNPFKNIEIDDRKFDPAVILAAAPAAAVAVGLALRRPGDKAP